MSHSPHASDVEIRELYLELMSAWNAGDAERFTAVFWPDGDLVGFDGTHLRGIEEIRPHHDDLFRLYVTGTRLVGLVRSVRFIGEDAALMHAEGGTVMPGQDHVDPDRNSIQTLVATRRDGRWRLAAFQNTRTVYFGRPERLDRLTAELDALV